MYDLTTNISSTGITEINTAFLGSNFNGFANAAQFFDQYCIYGVTATINTLISTSVGGPVQCYTAIDYDSVSLVGKTGIQSYSSCNYTALSPGALDSVVRLVKPCIAPQVTSSSLPVAGGVSRQWLDIAYPSVQHFGLRSVLDIYSSNVTAAVHYSFAAVFGFRNTQ